jgi:CBS-domain-containing membrane protein
VATAGVRVSGYLSKLSGATAATPAINVTDSLISGIGGILGIGLTSYLSFKTGFPWLTAPFGATSVLVYAAHKVPFAQPRNVIGGYIMSALAGFLVMALFGNTWWSLGIGVGLAITFMGITGTTHPPAGGVPIIIITSKAAWTFMFSPLLLGTLVLVAVGVFYNNLFKSRHYPQYWY